MAFTPAQVEEFLETLQQDPLLRDRVRNVILADDFLALPGIVARLGDRMDQLGERMDQLSVRVESLTNRIDALTLEVKGLVEQMHNHTLSMRLWTGETANMKGLLFEMNFERKLSARLGKRFRKATALPIYDIEPFYDAMKSGLLTPEEVDDAALLDIVASAKDASASNEEVLVAIEVSVTVDPSDVICAARRAGILAKCGLRAIPLVAGESITWEGRAAGAQFGVVEAIQKREPVEPPDQAA